MINNKKEGGDKILNRIKEKISRDTLTKGVVSGILANFIVTIYSILTYLIGWNETFMYEVAAGAFLEKKSVETLVGTVIGIATDFGVSALFGLVLALILKATTNNFWWLKGILLAVAWWIFFYGLLVGTQATARNILDIGTNAQQLSVHLLLGFLTPYFIIRLDALEE